jgi:stage IV sporulation protein B
VCDIDTKKVLPISQGECTGVKLTGFSKGTSGSAGELSGFLESTSIGDVYYNGSLGVYGKFNQTPLTTPCDLATIDEVKTGAAKIYTTIENGAIEEYEIEIVRIEKNSQDNKHLTIKVKDENLISKTGGIVQGMSGSPIIQNGKLIGAVTHVFLNDPTGGYGIFAETMYETLSQISLKHLDKAS